MKLRQPQLDAYNATLTAFESHNSVLVVKPTGTGKTVLFGKLAGDWQQGRVLVCARQNELVDQARNKIYRMTGIMPDKEQAENWANESSWARNHCVVGSTQTLLSKSKEFPLARYHRFEGIGLVILDEADNQLTAPTARMVKHFLDQGAKLFGVTASPIRSDGKAMLNMYETCAYEMSIATALSEGWLVRPKVNCLQLKSLDLSQVRITSTGDFAEDELGEVMEDDKVILEIAAAVAETSGSMKTVVFCTRVEQARKVARVLLDTYHLKADWVCGDKKLCDERRRKQINESFTQDPDGTQIVCNVGVYARGWDFPGLMHIVNGRPTLSLNWFTQMFGRGTRPLEGVVDFEGSTAESRLAAIAASAKPFWLYTDLRDVAMSQKLISPVDVLAGHLGLAIKKKAKQLTEKAGTAGDVSQFIKDAQAIVEERERRKLAKASSAAKASFNSVEVDVFDRSQTGRPVKSGGRVARMIYGPHKGEALEDLKSGYLTSVLRYHKNAPKWLIVAIGNELRKRDRANRPQYSGPIEDVNAIFQEAARGAVTPRPKPAIAPAIDYSFLDSFSKEAEAIYATQSG